MSEAEDRHLAEVGEDCRVVLGHGIVWLGLKLDHDDAAVRLVARYRLGDKEWESAASGPSVVAAHADLRTRLLVDRIRLGFTALVEPH